MIRTVFFHGPLRSTIEGPIQITGNTVAEVLEGISRQLPQLQPNPTTGRVRISVAGFDTVEDLFTDLGDQTEIHICPQLFGGKNSGFTQILIGSLLIGASFIPGIGPQLAKMMIQVGAMQILGGIAALLAPVPEDDRDTDRSKYLGAPRNTTKIGTRIPILYGEYRWGGHYLSFDINALEFQGNGQA